MQLKTAGDLRGFLADVLVGIRDGSIDANQANSISKVASQINSSLACEIQARIHLKELGQDNAGEMVIASPRKSESPPAPASPAYAADDDEPEPVPIAKAPVKPIASVLPGKHSAERIWCDQCEMRVTTSQAVGCKSAFCKAKEAA